MLDFFTQNRLEEILGRFGDISIAVVGDGSLDVYWEADMTRSELSRETPHFPLPVVKERTSLGGGANVAANLVALGIKRAGLLTVIGKDWRGYEFRELLNQQGIDTSLLLEAEDRITPAYCKPLRSGYGDIWYEDPRIDFINTTPIDAATEKRALAELLLISDLYDGLVVADQLDNGLITSSFRDELNRLGLKKLIAVDSRDKIHLYKNVILKPNHIEALRSVSCNLEPDKVNAQDLINVGRQLSMVTNSEVLITAGELGAFWVERSGCSEQMATKPAEPPVDTVGAGDSFMAAFVASRAAGAEPREAIFVANLAARVVVKKLKVTGTATPQEILREYSLIQGM